MDYDQFNKIKKEYNEFTKSFLNQGRLPLGPTTKGYWGASIIEELAKLFKKIDLGKYKNFIDLGSGDGRVVFVASLFTKAYGIEGDKDLYDHSIKMKEKLGRDVEFLNKDYNEIDLSEYDVLFLYPDKRDNKFFNKLKNEVKGLLIVEGVHFNPELKKVDTIEIEGTIFSLYSRIVNKLNIV